MHRNLEYFVPPPFQFVSACVVAQPTLKDGTGPQWADLRVNPHTSPRGGEEFEW
jgi:hypothetical protein